MSRARGRGARDGRTGDAIEGLGRWFDVFRAILCLGHHWAGWAEGAGAGEVHGGGQKQGLGRGAGEGAPQGAVRVDRSLTGSSCSRRPVPDRHVPPFSRGCRPSGNCFPSHDISFPFIRHGPHFLHISSAVVSTPFKNVSLLLCLNPASAADGSLSCFLPTRCSRL